MWLDMWLDIPMNSNDIRYEVINEGAKYYAVVIGEAVNYKGEASVRILAAVRSVEAQVGAT